MAKSPDAFRTISEVADWLGVQAHVLRFWESKFAQVKPIKRAGGRRYYRPADMLLLGGLKKVLHEDGLTIKGAQKLLREHGVSHVASLSQPLDDLTTAVIEGSSTPVGAESHEQVVDAVPAVETANVAQEPADLTAPEMVDDMPAEAAQTQDDQPDLPLEDDPQDAQQAAAREEAPSEETGLPSFRARPRETPPPAPHEATLPAADSETPAEPTAEPEAPKSPKPNRIDVTLVHDHTQIEVTPSALSAISGIRHLSSEQAQEIRPLLARLTRLRASMSSPRKDPRKD